MDHKTAIAEIFATADLLAERFSCSRSRALHLLAQLAQPAPTNVAYAPQSRGAPDHLKRPKYNRERKPDFTIEQYGAAVRSYVANIRAGRTIMLGTISKDNGISQSHLSIAAMREFVSTLGGKMLTDELYQAGVGAPPDGP